MGILNFKSDGDIAKLQAKLRAVQEACDRTRASRVAAAAALVDVSEKLAAATLYGEDVSLLQSDFVQTERQLAAFDLALKRGDADAEALRLQIAAATDRTAREADAAQLESAATEIEKLHGPAKKAVAALTQGYFAVPNVAVSTMGGNVLAHAFPWMKNFLEGGELTTLVSILRQKATDLREGRAAPGAVAETVGSRSASFGVKVA